MADEDIKAQDTGKILAQIGAEDSPLMIKLDEYKGRRLVDVRRYYKDKKTKNFLPTRKGLSLTIGTFSSLEEIAYKFGKDIKEWLSSANSNGLEMVRRSEAVEKNSEFAQDFEIKFDSWRGNSFFSVKSEGSKNVVTFNTFNAFVEGTKSKKNHDEIFYSMAAVIVTFKRAAYRFDDDDFNYESLFSSLEYEWGNLLKHYPVEK